MVLLIILGVVVLMTFFVIGFLFFTLDKEGHGPQEHKAVSLTDLVPLKREMSAATPGPETPKTADGPQIVSSKYSAGEDIYKKRAQDLEEELRGISKKAEDEFHESRQIITNLTKENESLKSQQAILAQAQQKLTELQTQSDHLHTENSGLQTQLESSNGKVRLLEEEMAALKIQMGQLTTEANAKASQLESSNGKARLLEEEMAALKIQMGQQITEANAKASQLNLEKESLVSNLEKADQKLHELNGALTQKIDLLQYELVKAKAQSAGLERIGYNYKNQLENLLQKT